MDRTPPSAPRLRRGEPVSTRDGAGVVVAHLKRGNTNGGPGCHQYRVRLDDGRIRCYGANAVTPK